MLRQLVELHNDESGQDIIEYVFIAAAIGVAGFAIIPNVASSVSSYWGKLSGQLT
jgi:Flp pilus assembly pilin Flp